MTLWSAKTWVKGALGDEVDRLLMKRIVEEERLSDRGFLKKALGLGEFSGFKDKAKRVRSL